MSTPTASSRASTCCSPQLAELVKARPEELPERVDAALTRLKDAEREIARMRSAAMVANLDGILGEGAGRRPGPVVDLRGARGHRRRGPARDGVQGSRLRASRDPVGGRGRRVSTARRCRSSRRPTRPAAPPAPRPTACCRRPSPRSAAAAEARTTWRRAAAPGADRRRRPRSRAVADAAARHGRSVTSHRRRGLPAGHPDRDRRRVRPGRRGPHRPRRPARRAGRDPGAPEGGRGSAHRPRGGWPTLVAEYEPLELVVGLPLTLDGAEGPAAAVGAVPTSRISPAC